MAPSYPQQSYPQRQGNQSKYPQVCRVYVNTSTFEGQCGTGAWVAYRDKDGEKYGGILTSCHTFRDDRTGAIIKDGIRCTFPMIGQQINCRLAIYSVEQDWAILTYDEKPRVLPVVLADGPPSPGEQVTLIGLGGYPVERFRAADTKVISDTGNGSVWAGLGSIEGDSGGPVINSRGQVCGIIRGTDTATERTTLVCCRFFGRIFGCYSNPPRTRLWPLEPSTPPVVTPPQVVSPIVDYDMIIAKLKEDSEFLSKIAGKDGKDGRDGKDGATGPKGERGDTAELTPTQLAAVTAAIIQHLKSDSEFLASVTGPSGKDGKDGELDASSLPPIRIQTLTESGSVHQDVTARLGDLIRLQPLVIKVGKN